MLQMHLTLDRHQQTQAVLQALLVDHGTGNNAFFPELVVIHDPNWPYYGIYDPNSFELVINFAHCRTWTVVVKTLLHEFKHYLQDRTRTDVDEYEREAVEFQSNYKTYL